jgi:hypothetical protein
MIKTLEKEIQDLISTSLISLERDHLALLAAGQEELQRINKLADVIDESGDVCTSSLMFSLFFLTYSNLPFPILV